MSSLREATVLENRVGTREESIASQIKALEWALEEVKAGKSHGLMLFFATESQVHLRQAMPRSETLFFVEALSKSRDDLLHDLEASIDWHAEDKK